ncbi:hypothetical protein NAEGRDRAFT_65926 [Naegleria gruberi]|uniref:Uncharacterized protein n=1 Tax=Naegleria gruberi TaxID=5762 RepID=D2VAP3_NAEGR|nr:uncharacterized protein NAEGRDRAFT_65926 [Naegleria gruberi]EFC46111.1 hypothetical protein NAEGRDRAFT_65926 [Naegleria gruberi]|eukprot:XP_002678855.1 hypothetical protein NAEGRDRAFT_65926 [Naegleria gruberi strain NEG-M]
MSSGVKKTDSNRCPICQRNGIVCTHGISLHQKCCLPRMFCAEENRNIADIPVPANKREIFDDFILASVQEFAHHLEDRNYSRKRAEYKMKLGEFYEKLHRFAKNGFTAELPDDFHRVIHGAAEVKPTFYAPTLVDLFGSFSTNGSVMANHQSHQSNHQQQAKEEKVSPSKITKPPHRMNSSNASIVHQQQYFECASFFGTVQRNTFETPIIIEEEDEDEVVILQPHDSNPTQNAPVMPNVNVPNHGNQIGSMIAESELPDAFSTRSVRSANEDQKLVQIELKQVNYIAKLTKSDLDSVRDFVIALKQELPVSNNFTISEILILNPKTRDFCLANKKALAIARDEWFKDDICLIFKVDGIQKDELPVTNHHIYM